MAAIFKRGKPQMIPYTPTSGNVAEGDIVVLGNTEGITTGVVHRPIVSNTLGEIAIGGGIYELTAGANTNAFVHVSISDVANTTFEVTDNSSTALFGYTVEDVVGNNVSEVLHDPLVPFVLP